MFPLDYWALTSEIRKQDFILLFSSLTCTSITPALSVEAAKHWSLSGSGPVAGECLAPTHGAPYPAAEPISARQPALRPHVHKQPEKTTRVRTVLNEKQLHTLRTCYAANPRPDALMKEQLVEMTGLSPRVIRVWFQNKRCKDKKRSIMMKQLQQQQPNDKTVSGAGAGQGTQGKQRRCARCVPAAQVGCYWISILLWNRSPDRWHLTPT